MRTILWFAYFWLYLLLCIPASGYVWYLEKRGRDADADRLVERFVANWARRLLYFAGAKVTVTGEENLIDRPAVYIANHQGYFDIPLMLACVGKPRGLIAKQEIDKIPGIRTWMRHLHCLFVDRSSPRAGAQVMLDGAALLETGRSLTILPGGTRSRGGEMHEFKAGAFRIASRVGAPIVPVTIDGSYKLMEANHFWIHPAEVRITIHPAIETAGMSRPEIKALPEKTLEIITSVL